MYPATSNANEAEAIGTEDATNAHAIDRALRRLAKQRAGLDAEEARWLRLADAQQAWRPLGYVHASEYLEDVFGYAPRTAAERLRVARELGELHQLDAALGAGELSYSVVRELTRVATPETEARWLARARGQTLRLVEQLVSGKHKGSDPDDRPDPKLVRHGVWMELDAESFAILRQLRQVVAAEQGTKLDDKAFVVALGRRVLASANDNSTGPAHMIQVTKCRECQRGWQDGGGLRVELDAATIERIECDAIVCDDKNRGGRAKRTISAIMWRKVMERDHRSCRVPGCRASRNLDVHHVVHRARGGLNELSNLVVLCGGHHKLHHDGLLEITGSPPDKLVFIRDGQRLGGDTQPTPKAMLARHTSRTTAPASADEKMLAALEQAGYPDPTRAT